MTSPCSPSHNTHTHISNTHIHTQAHTRAEVSPPLFLLVSSSLAPPRLRVSSVKAKPVSLKQHTHPVTQSYTHKNVSRRDCRCLCATLLRHLGQQHPRIGGALCKLATAVQLRVSVGEGEGNWECLLGMEQQAHLPFASCPLFPLPPTFPPSLPPAAFTYSLTRTYIPLISYTHTHTQRDNSMLTFEGQQFLGINNIAQKMSSLGKLAHNVQRFDVQPSVDPNNLVIFVVGQVKLEGQDNPLQFAEMFQLVAAGPGNFYIQNEIFRLIYG